MRTFLPDSWPKTDTINKQNQNKYKSNQHSITGFKLTFLLWLLKIVTSFFLLSSHSHLFSFLLNKKTVSHASVHLLHIYRDPPGLTPIFRVSETDKKTRVEWCISSEHIYFMDVYFANQWAYLTDHHVHLLLVRICSLLANLIALQRK